MNLEQQCNRAGSCARHLCFSAFLTSAGACTRARLPEPRPPLSESPCSFLPASACARAPRPNHCPSRPGQRPHPPLFSPVSLACRRLRPGPPATIAIANNTFLVAVDSYSSARMSQERRTRRRVGELRRRRWH